MKLGMNLFYWTTHLAQDQFPLLGQMKALGFDGVELPIFDADLDHYRQVRQALDDQALGRTAITVIPDASHSPVSDDPADRNRGLEHLKRVIDCCHAIDADLLTGPFHQPLGQFSGQAPTDTEKQRCADVHREAADYAQQANLALVIEPLNRFECYMLNTMEQAADHVQRVGHPNFYTMFDSFHASIEEKNPVDALRQHIPITRHIHLSENDRGTLGSGHIPTQTIVQTLVEAGYNQWLTIESFSRALPDLAAATCVWRDFDPPGTAPRDSLKFLREIVQPLTAPATG